MRKILFILVLMFGYLSIAQDDIKEDSIAALIEKYASKLNLKCNIDIKIDVVGMVIPDKQIYVEFKEDMRPIIKGKGLALLPKKGIVGQFNELFSTPLQPILLSKRGNDLIYKLVSLDQKTDWITADIVFDESSLLISEATINTRKQGTFYTQHFIWIRNILQNQLLCLTFKNLISL